MQLEFTTIEKQPYHFYQSGGVNTEILQEKEHVVIVHGHSSILTCRGFDHAVIVPISATRFDSENRSQVPPNR